jgi:hypothetical protein
MWRSIVICPFFVPAVVIADGHPATRRTWRAESVGRLRKPPALETSTHRHPEAPISRFQTALFPPARIATAHWAARDHPHLDLVHASTRTLPIVATPLSTCTTNPLRLAPLCLSTCFVSFAFFLFISPCTNCNHFTNNVEPPLGRLVNITLTHLVAS